MYGKSLDQFPERLEGFLQVLAGVSLPAMDAGFAECLNTCAEFPVPKEVLEAATQWQLDSIPRAETQKILDRGDKPAELMPVSAASASTIGALTRGRRDVSQDEIQQWLADGKAKWWARLDKLRADHKWVELQSGYGVPEYRKQAESLAAEANGPSTIPADPIERAAWARRKAVENGWCHE